MTATMSVAARTLAMSSSWMPTYALRGRTVAVAADDRRSLGRSGVGPWLPEPSTAWAAASRATGTRNGEHDT